MNKKTALITGASSGMDKEFASYHASQGGNLVLVARNKERLDQLREELEKEYQVHVLIIDKNLSLADAPKDIYNKVKARNIEIDYLINNAGFGGRGILKRNLC
jgi:Short-chain dehydrogenases of various substrate specificities